MNSPTGHTRPRIFTLDGSNDANSRNDVPFAGFRWYCSSYLNPPPQFLGREKAFSRKTGNILKVSCYRNYGIDFNQIWHNDRDYQVVIAGCPNRRPTNTRWRTAAISKQEAQLSPRDRAMRRVNLNLANCHATVQKLVIRQVLTKSMVWSWRFNRRQCVIDNVHATMTRPSRLPQHNIT